MFDDILNFIHAHLIAMVITVPVLLLCLLFIFVEYMNTILGPDEEWPDTNVSQSEIEDAINDDPNT